MYSFFLGQASAVWSASTPPERSNVGQSCSKHICILYFLGRLLPSDRHPRPLSGVMRGRVAASTYVFFISWADFCHLIGIHAPERCNGVQSCSKHIYILYFLGRLLPSDRHQRPLSRVMRGRVAASTYVFFISWAGFCRPRGILAPWAASGVTGGRVAASTYVFFISWADFCTVFRTFMNIIAKQALFMFLLYFSHWHIFACLSNKALWHMVQQTKPCGIQYNKQGPVAYSTTNVGPALIF